ncbi:MAG: hypothetical protein GQ574_14855 [Crocinitomix sp.]|nr:hypothetical protein [Crocinitomix sp.]
MNRIVFDYLRLIMYGLKFLLKFLVGRDYDKVVAEKIQNLSTVPVFFNSDSELHIKVRKINDYRCMSLTLVCNHQVNTVSAIALEFMSNNASQTVYSEYEHVEGDYSPRGVLCIAKFDVEFTPMLDSFLASEKIISLAIRIPNGAEYNGTHLIELNQVNDVELNKIC